MPFGAILGGIVSGLGSIFGARQAAKPQQQALEKLNQFIGPGTAGTNYLLQALTPGGQFNFQGTPGFEFAKEQGIDAIQNSAAARGGVVSGNTLKALQGFGTGLASQNFNQYLQALLGLSSIGESAAAGSGSTATNLGATNAAGITGGVNALTGTLPYLFGGLGGGGSSNAIPSLGGYGGSQGPISFGGYSFGPFH